MDTKRAGRLSGIHTEPYGRSAAKNLVQGPRFFKREQISNGGPFWHRHIAAALRGITRHSSRWTIGLKALQASEDARLEKKQARRDRRACPEA